MPKKTCLQLRKKVHSVFSIKKIIGNRHEHEQIWLPKRRPCKCGRAKAQKKTTMVSTISLRTERQKATIHWPCALPPKHKCAKAHACRKCSGWSTRAWGHASIATCTKSIECETKHIGVINSETTRSNCKGNTKQCNQHQHWTQPKKNSKKVNKWILKQSRSHLQLGTNTTTPMALTSTHSDEGEPLAADTPPGDKDEHAAASTAVAKESHDHHRRQLTMAMACATHGCPGQASRHCEKPYGEQLCRNCCDCVGHGRRSQRGEPR